MQTLALCILQNILCNFKSHYVSTLDISSTVSLILSLSTRNYINSHIHVEFDNLQKPQQYRKPQKPLCFEITPFCSGSVCTDLYTIMLLKNNIDSVPIFDDAPNCYKSAYRPIFSTCSLNLHLYMRSIQYTRVHVYCRWRIVFR